MRDSRSFACAICAIVFWTVIVFSFVLYTAWRDSSANPEYTAYQQLLIEQAGR